MQSPCARTMGGAELESNISANSLNINHRRIWQGEEAFRFLIRFSHEDGGWQVFQVVSLVEEGAPDSSSSRTRHTLRDDNLKILMGDSSKRDGIVQIACRAGIELKTANIQARSVQCDVDFSLTDWSQISKQLHFPNKTTTTIQKFIHDSNIQPLTPVHSHHKRDAAWLLLGKLFMPSTVNNTYSTLRPSAFVRHLPFCMCSLLSCNFNHPSYLFEGPPHSVLSLLLTKASYHFIF